MNKDSMAYKGVLLGVLCAFCGLALSGVNAITAPKIAEARMAKIKANLEQFYPGATFSEITDYQDDTKLVTGVYEAEGQGMIYNLKVTGYNSSGFTFMVAYNNDGTVAGFTPIEQNETSGFGSRCFDPEYINQILELTADDDAPLLSGATLTSSAIRNGMAAASALFEAGK
ncbi:MAG: FMN-binding protein [Solobacterium sp.]|nr:FMN-binding protein [Solobacterium sp.]MBQ1322000.1 FMN-binding protein [Solobacterium sp.]